MGGRGSTAYVTVRNKCACFLCNIGKLPYAHLNALLCPVYVSQNRYHFNLLQRVRVRVRAARDLGLGLGLQDVAREQCLGNFRQSEDGEWQIGSFFPGALLRRIG